MVFFQKFKILKTLNGDCPDEDVAIPQMMLKTILCDSSKKEKIDLLGMSFGDFQMLGGTLH